MFTLMIVDDSNIIRQKIELAMQEQFEVVAKASNGAQALEFYQQMKPDVVTMDLTMPSLDGLGCIKKLKELDPDVKILVVSALSDKATALQAISLGAKGFVNKPFNNEQLESALMRVVTYKSKKKS